MKKQIDFSEISAHKTPERSPGFLLWHVSSTWRSFIEAVLKPIGLTHPQFVVLATLGWLTRNGAHVTQAAIGKMAGLDPNTISQIIKKLEQKKLIFRSPSSDARAKKPVLTDLGSAVLTRALPAVEAADAQFFDQITPSQRKSVIRIFQKMTCV